MFFLDIPNKRIKGYYLKLILSKFIMVFIYTRLLNFIIIRINWWERLEKP